MGKSDFFASRRVLCLLAGVVVLCMLLSGCSGAVSNADDVQSDFSLSLPASTVSEVLIETHGGFHGDKETGGCLTSGG